MSSLHFANAWNVLSALSKPVFKKDAAAIPKKEVIKKSEEKPSNSWL